MWARPDGQADDAVMCVTPSSLGPSAVPTRALLACGLSRQSESEASGASWGGTAGVPMLQVGTPSGHIFLSCCAPGGALGGRGGLPPSLPSFSQGVAQLPAPGGGPLRSLAPAPWLGLSFSASMCSL